MWVNPQFPTNLVAFTEKILTRKLHFLCSVTVHNLNLGNQFISCLWSFTIPSQACNFTIKEILTQMFSCELCEISENAFSHRTPLVGASMFSKTQSVRNQLILTNRKSLHLFLIFVSITWMVSIKLSELTQINLLIKDLKCLDSNHRIEQI